MTTLRNQTEGDLIEAFVVFVREYPRLRLGHWEVVRSHIYGSCAAIVPLSRCILDK